MSDLFSFLAQNPPPSRFIIKLCAYAFFGILLVAAIAITRLMPRWRLRIAVTLIVVGLIAFVPLLLFLNGVLTSVPEAYHDTLFIVGGIGFIFALLGLIMAWVISKAKQEAENDY